MMYVVNEDTKEHRVAVPGRVYGGRWYFVPADEDGWINWNTGECPLPDKALHQIKMRDGEVSDPDCEPNGWVWLHNEGDGDIIAYRPILENDTPKAIEWDGEGFPPVGTICELSRTSGDDMVARVLAYGKHGHDDAVLVCENHQGVDGQMYGFLCKCVEFRPLKSEEDKAVEALRVFLNSRFKAPNNKPSRVDMCRAIYRAIQEGEVPGVKLDD